jgi:hypothetical protein
MHIPSTRSLLGRVPDPAYRQANDFASTAEICACGWSRQFAFVVGSGGANDTRDVTGEAKAPGT